MSTAGSPTRAPRAPDGPGSPAPPLAPVRVASTADEVTDRLVTAIALGAFVPGERLPAERELSRMLGVSRSTVREAIGRLRTAGVVDIRRGRAGGAYVGARWSGDSARAVRRTLQPRLPDLELLFDLRSRVEEMVARAAAERRTAEDVGALEAALAAFAAATGPVEEHRCDSLLHDAVLGAAGNPHLTALSRDLLSRVSLGLPYEPYRRDVYDRALREHTALVRAVVAGDVERAGRTARDHFALSAEALRQTLADGVAEDAGRSGDAGPAGDAGDAAGRALALAAVVSGAPAAAVRADPRWPAVEAAVLHEALEGGALEGGAPAPLTSHLRALARAVEDGRREPGPAGLELLAALERLERLGRPLRAVVAVVPAPARAAHGPLLGTPVAVKDMIDVAGLVRGDGNPTAMRGAPAARDATAVARLREAASDVFATTTLLEHAAGAPHPDLPEALNPLAAGRTAGGSSGGSAALVGAGVCRAALGTDTGGSIRLPAHYCGVVGVKPTSGTVPVDGVSPLAPSLDAVGVLAATVQDAARVLAVLAARPALALAPGEGGRGVAGLRVGVLRGQLASPRLDPELARRTAGALDLLVAQGATAVDRDDAVLAELGDLLAPILLVEAWAVHGDRVRSDPGAYGAATLRLLRAAGGTDPAARDAALARRDELLPAAEALLDGVDVLLGPAAPFAAPELTPPIDTPEGEAEGLFSSPFNVTGQPAVVLPAGRTDDGRPFGVQLVARRGEDAALLAACARVEAVLSRRTGPPAG